MDIAFLIPHVSRIFGGTSGGGEDAWYGPARDVSII